MNWDCDIPASVEDVIALLTRRIEIHRRWATFIHDDPGGSSAAVGAGVGTFESHERYAQQYEAAVRVLKE